MKKLTREQAAIIGVYTGFSVGPFEDIHEYAEHLLGRPVLTYEFADKNIWDELGRLSHSEFIKLAADRTTKFELEKAI